jgi:hypothetical protein
MNRDRARELLPIIQAYAEGKEIECMPEDGDRWFISSSPSWSISNKYRIKPEPKTGWINIYPKSLVSNSCRSKEEADEAAGTDRIACIQITYTEGEGL